MHTSRRAAHDSSTLRAHRASTSGPLSLGPTTASWHGAKRPNLYRRLLRRSNTGARRRLAVNLLRLYTTELFLAPLALDGIPFRRLTSFLPRSAAGLE